MTAALAFCATKLVATVKSFTGPAPGSVLMTSRLDPAVAKTGHHQLLALGWVFTKRLANILVDRTDGESSE